MKALLPLLVAATALASSCVVEEPPGPATVVVTVHPWPAAAPRPAELLDEAVAFDLPASPTDPWQRVAALFTAARSDATAPDERRLEGSATTLAETLTAEGFETGAFLSGDTFDETSGILQGFLHLDEGWLRAHSGADTGPAGAAFAAAQFVRLKIPRPLEDTAFAWLHLDLSGASSGDASNGDASSGDSADGLAALESALAEVLDGLAGDPDAVIALVDLSGSGGALAVRGPVGTARSETGASGTEPSEALALDAFAALLRSTMRAADSANATNSTGTEGGTER